MSKEAAIKDVISTVLGVKEGEITLDADFVNDLGADSLDAVELVMAIEEEFKIEIEDDEAESLTSLRKVVEFMEKKAV